jgi:hypothetical protein
MTRQKIKDLRDAPPSQEEKLASEVKDLKASLKQRDQKVQLLEKSLSDSREARLKQIPKAKTRARKKEDWVRVIISDTHGSKVDPSAFAAVLADIKRLDPDEIIHLGDSIDCGGFLAEHHTLGFVAETEYTYEDDVIAANSHFDELQKAAPKALLHLLEGNHERRVET